MLHKYVQIAVMNHNTTYHESTGCEPSTVFHGRIPYNALDLKLGIKPQWQQQHNTELAGQLQKQLNEMENVVKENLMLSYIKYKRYYDRKADATPLKVNEYCYVLNPKADNQSTKFSFNECIWTGPYVIVKVLSNNNYTIRKLGTRYTQTLHRIRLRIYKPDRCLPDVTVKQTDYRPDPDVLVQHNEWYAKACESNFEDQNENITTTNQTTSNTQNVQEIISNDNHSTIDEDITSYPDFSNLTTDAGENPLVTSPPPIDDIDHQDESSPISVGYIPRKVSDYNLRPNSMPKVNPDFRRLDAIDLTQNKKQTEPV